MVLKEILGKERAFEFGTRTFVFIHELTGVKFIEEVFERLANKRKSEMPTVNPDDVFASEPIVSEIEHMDFIAKFMFACAKTGAELTDQPIDFNEGKVSAWMDEMGFEEAMMLINKLIEVYSEKNFKAPIKGPQRKAA